MNSKAFKITRDEFSRRKKTILQHKLRVVLKCYTVFNFVLNEENGNFTFSKSYKIRGRRIEDQNILEGYFELEDIDDDHLKLRISVL